MNAIDIKLWRALWKMRVQALAISMVIVSGVAIFIMSLSTYDSLYQTRENYYVNNQFADIFATLKRAPNSLEKRIEAIEGVDRVESRVVTYVNIDIEGYPDPASAHIISVPDKGPSKLNHLYLESGRLIDSSRDDEVLVSVNFAKAHRLQLGDKISAIINGHKKQLTLVGIVQSPEYIFQIAPGAVFPDYKSYGVMWMARTPLSSAYDMFGAFNDVVLTIQDGYDAQDIINKLDDLLSPYGGVGAIPRTDQLSNRFVEDELRQLANMATQFPVIFFAVAAFLLNVVISRLIALEREQIATLKAFGYNNFAIGLHYTKLVMVIVSIGAVIGILIGVKLGQALGSVYQDLYSFPFFNYLLDPLVLASSVIISYLVAFLGTIFAVSKAVKLAPSEGMRPEVPAIYRQTLIEKLGLQERFSQPTRMIFRQIERKPLKSFLTTIGISFACGIMMVSGFQGGSIGEMIHVQYNLSQREDATIYFAEPTNNNSLNSLRSIPGIEYAESFRMINANLKFEHRSYRMGINGVPEKSHISHILDTNLQRINIEKEGVVLTDYLADILKVKTGDILTIEVLEANRPTIEVPVVGIAKQYLGINAYMPRAYLNRVLKEGNVISGAYLKVDEIHEKSVYRQLKGMPQTAGVVTTKSSVAGFMDTIENTILLFSLISSFLAATIAFGVIYNSLQISLSERSRELASLRVLGFHKSEIAYILLGEQGLLTLFAIPIGFVFGYWMSSYIAMTSASDLYRLPLVLQTDVYALAATIVILSSIISAMMLWRKMTRLDMVAVLKAKE